MEKSRDQFWGLCQVWLHLGAHLICPPTTVAVSLGHRAFSSRSGSLKHRIQLYMLSVLFQIHIFEQPHRIPLHIFERDSDSVYVRLTSFCILSDPVFSRYGLREGFRNLELKKVHDVGTKFMEATPVSVHENVPGYEEAGESQ